MGLSWGGTRVRSAFQGDSISYRVEAGWPWWVRGGQQGDKGRHTREHYRQDGFGGKVWVNAKSRLGDMWPEVAQESRQGPEIEP